MINAIIDLSHNNANPDFKQIAGAGILGVFHKASQGAGYADPTYAARRAAAKAAGLLWGAYHFGTGEDPEAQAKKFLSVTGTPADELLVLDFEPDTTPGQTTMSLAQAEAFVQYIQKATNRWPGVYSGSLAKQDLGSSTKSPLGNCWFWLSEYGPKAIVPPLWKDWTFWQYTDGTVNAAPADAVPGVGKCDRERFNGTADQLRAFWQAGGAAAGAAVA
ncbi:MAG TPA: glycoside hydrolase family 25 protein [Alphaproteobacteria bacterium]|nr:glycoside hydrolase family 25 protein [Alphaproteobacteria bacterium]